MGDEAGAGVLFREAIARYEAILEADQASLGDEHACTLDALDRLAGLHQSVGDAIIAEGLFRELIEKRSRVLGPADPKTLHSIEELVQLHCISENWSEALSLARDLLDATPLESYEHEDRQHLLDFIEFQLEQHH
jgi:hypothetical protein